MPCYTVQSTEVDLGKANPAILEKALLALGLHRHVSEGTFYGNGLTVTVRDGVVNVQEVVMSGGAAKLNAQDIQRAYATETVRYQAKKFGWNVAQDAKGKLTLTRKA